MVLGPGEVSTTGYRSAKWVSVIPRRMGRDIRTFFLKSSVNFLSKFTTTEFYSKRPAARSRVNIMTSIERESVTDLPFTRRCLRSVSIDRRAGACVSTQDGWGTGGEPRQDATALHLPPGGPWLRRGRPSGPSTRTFCSRAAEERCSPSSDSFLNGAERVAKLHRPCISPG